MSQMAQYSEASAAIFRGIIAGCVLSGIILTQSIQHFTSSTLVPRRFERIIVVLCSFFGVGIFTIEVLRAFQYLVLHGGNKTYAQAYHNIDSVFRIFSILGQVVAECWFIERAWRTVGHSFLYLFSATAVLLAQLLCVFVNFALTVNHRRNPKYIKVLARLYLTTQICTAVVNVLTSCVLVYQVSRRLQSAVGVWGRRWHDVFRLTLATGAVNAAIAVSATIVYSTSSHLPKTSFPLMQTLPHIAILSALISINSRSKFRDSLAVDFGPSPAPVARAPILRRRSHSKTLPRLDTSAFERVYPVPALLNAWDRPPVSTPDTEEIKEIASVVDLEGAVIVIEHGRDLDSIAESTKTPDSNSPMLGSRSVVAPAFVRPAPPRSGAKVVTLNVQR